MTKGTQSRCRTVLLVAPHFIPSFLPSVHRARLWSYHLKEFGWKPIILTTDPAYYECQVSREMEALLPPDLEIIRTRAIPTRPIRFVGDIGIRSLWWYWQALNQLEHLRKVNFVHFTVPAFTPALLGPGFYRKTGIPFGIDYIDPWIPESPQGLRFGSKHWLVEKMSHVLEPFALRNIRLITGINDAYFKSVLKRHPYLRGRVVTAGMPYGGSEKDYEALERSPRDPFLFKEKGPIHVLYAGALLPKAFGVLDRLLESVSVLQKEDQTLAKKLRIHFVGTGTMENNPLRGHTVQPYIDRHGVGALVRELPSRIGYLDVLNHLRESNGVLVIGSSEPHYSPSKIYQAVMSRRPVLALLHEQSTAAESLRESGAGTVISFTEKRLPDVKNLTQILKEFCREASIQTPKKIDGEAFQKVSARESSRVLAHALDKAVD